MPRPARRPSFTEAKLTPVPRIVLSGMHDVKIIAFFTAISVLFLVQNSTFRPFCYVGDAALISQSCTIRKMPRQ
jgi:hypothetical protein